MGKGQGLCPLPRARCPARPRPGPRSDHDPHYLERRDFAHRAGAMRLLPYTWRPCADVARGLRRCPPLGEGHQGRSADAAHAEVARDARLWRVQQRSVAVLVRDRVDCRMGRRRRARRASRSNGESTRETVESSSAMHSGFDRSSATCSRMRSSSPRKGGSWSRRAWARSREVTPRSRSR